jgi:hypothetical protein
MTESQGWLIIGALFTIAFHIIDDPFSDNSIPKVMYSIASILSFGMVIIKPLFV